MRFDLTKNAVEFEKGDNIPAPLGLPPPWKPADWLHVLSLASCSPCLSDLAPCAGLEDCDPRVIAHLARVQAEVEALLPANQPAPPPLGAATGPCAA